MPLTVNIIVIPIRHPASPAGNSVRTMIVYEGTMPPCARPKAMAST